MIDCKKPLMYSCTANRRGRVCPSTDTGTASHGMCARERQNLADLLGFIKQSQGSSTRLTNCKNLKGGENL